jgi:hypothetical protein
MLIGLEILKITGFTRKSLGYECVPLRKMVVIQLMFDRYHLALSHLLLAIGISKWTLLFSSIYR